MARNPIFRSASFPYHLYGRANNQEWFYLAAPIVWDIFRRRLNEAVQTQGLLVHAFVLMANHYHLLATCAGENVDRVMERLLKSVSREINRRAGRTNHVFGGPYRRTVITNWFHYHHAYRYVLQNPLRKGLSKRIDDFQYTSHRKGAGIILASHLFERQAREAIEARKYVNFSDWLNEEYVPEQEEIVRKALHRHTFALHPKRGSRRLPEALTYCESEAAPFGASCESEAVTSAALYSSGFPARIPGG